MNPSLDFPDAQKAVVHARALSDVEHAPLAGFMVLAVCTLLSLCAPESATWRWSLGVAAVLLVTPILVALLLPRRGLLVYRLSSLLYLLNGLLLAVIGYREISRIAPLLPEEWPALQTGIPWIAPLFSALYYLLQFHGWKERILRLPEVKKALADPPSEPARQEVHTLIAGSLAHHPLDGIEWAEFRTVPASLRNWRLFLKLDPEVHGPWRVVFGPEYAIVVSREGRRAEAVKRGALKIVAEDPTPGAKTIQCLLRWNSHLHEGRITPEHFSKIQAWNKG